MQCKKLPAVGPTERKCSFSDAPVSNGYVLTGFIASFSLVGSGAMVK